MRRITKISALTASLMLAGAGTAFADETTEDAINVEVTGGALSIAMTQAPSILAAVPELGFPEEVEGEMQINVSDSRGTGAGWSVYQTLDNLTYNGASDLLSPLTTDSVTVPRMDTIRDYGVIPGGADLSNNLPGFQSNQGTLATGQTLLTAEPGSGMGVFDATYAVSLYVPSNILAGSYIGSLTTTVVSGAL